MELLKQTAQIAAKEATADGINWNFSPMVDIARDPRWGRIAEGAGEDPYLGSQIARAMVEGYQGREDLAEPEIAQAEVIEQFLPEQMSEAEIEAEVEKVIAETGASGMQDMGKVMGMASGRLAPP